MRALTPALTLALAVVLGGCDDPARSTSPSGPAPAFSPSVSRFDLSDGYLTHISPPLGISFTLGLLTDVDDLADCGGDEGTPNNPVETDTRGFSQDVSTPAGPNHNLTRLKGTLVLYDALLFGSTDICEATEIGRGPGEFTATDSDVFLAGPGADSFGETITANLDLVGGGRAHLVIGLRIVVKPDGSVKVVVLRYDLKPIG
jgi:hypothetical protein